MISGPISPVTTSAQSWMYTPTRGHFPDGTRTTGQYAPNYGELQSFENFPEKITGPTVWKTEEYQNNPERWTHTFSKEELEEISKAAEGFYAAERPLINITKVFSN